MLRASAPTDTHICAVRHTPTVHTRNIIIEKKMKLKQKLAALLFAALITLPAAAQEKQDMFRPETSSVTSQSIAPDARAGGMGDIGAATDPDVVSQYWNPAKYPFTISRAGVSLNYTPWLRRLVSDIDLAYLSGY